MDFSCVELLLPHAILRGADSVDAEEISGQLWSRSLCRGTRSGDESLAEDDGSGRCRKWLLEV